MKRILLGFTFLLASVTILSSQSTYYGAGIGQALYWGDLNSPDFTTNLTKNNGYAFQVFVRKHINDYFSVKGNLMFSRVRSNDANSNVEWQLQRNLNFRSVLNELSAHIEFYPLKFSPNTAFNNWSPYLSVGLAGFYFNPTTSINGNEFELQPLGTEGQGMPGFDKKYNKIAGALSFGGGLAIRFSDGLIVHSDILCKRTTTDHLDDISGNYVNYFELFNSPTNGPLAATLADRTGEFLGSTEVLTRETGEKRGGPSVGDYYFAATISFSIILNDGKSFGRRSKSKIECPKF